MHEQALLKQLRDIHEYIPTAWWQQPWPYMVLFGCLSAMALLFLFLRWRKKVISRPLTLWERTLKELHTLERETDANRFYHQLTDILKSYLQERYSISVRHLTDQELVAKGNFGLPEPAAKNLVDILGSVTEIKFARGHALHNTMERDLQRAEQIVQLTIPLPDPKK